MRKSFFLGLAGLFAACSLTACGDSDFGLSTGDPVEYQIEAFQTLGYTDVESLSPTQFSVTIGDCRVTLIYLSGWRLGSDELGTLTPAPEEVEASARGQNLCSTPRSTPSPS